MSTRKLSVAVLAFTFMAGCAGEGADDPELDTEVSEIAPPPPTNLTVANVSGGFTTRQDLNWNTSAGAARYIVYRGTTGSGSETTYSSTAAPPFIANHQDPSTNLCWQVAAVAANGQISAKSNEVCLTTLGAQTVAPPTNVTATAVSATRVNLSWTAATGATSYRINRSVNGGAFSFLTSASGTSLSDINLTANTNYCYTVDTVANAGTSVDSAPPACTTTFVLGLEGYYRLSETMGATAADSSGFNRNATLSAGAAFSAAQPQAPIDPVTGNNEPHLDTGAAAGVATTPVVAAYRLSGAFSVAVWAYQPTAGADVRLVGMRNAGVCGGGAGWELSQTSGALKFIGQSQTLSFGSALPVGAWTHVAVTFPGAAGNTMRLYINGVQVASGAYTHANSIAAAVGIGHVGGCAGAAVSLDELQIYSRELTPTEVATLGTVPPAPTGLMIATNTSTSQALAWTSPPPPVDRWIIFRGTASGNEVHFTHAPFPPMQNPPPAFTATHLTPSTQYSWEVKAVSNHLISLPSNEVIATTQAGPAAPTGVTATAISQTRINVSWTAVTGAVRYFVFMSTAGGPYMPVAGAVTTTTKQVGGLTANTMYSFEVQAEDAGNTKSPMSAPASATTMP